MSKTRITGRQAATAQQMIATIGNATEFSCAELAARVGVQYPSRDFGLALWAAKQVLNAGQRRLFVPTGQGGHYHEATLQQRMRHASRSLTAVRRRFGRQEAILPTLTEAPPKAQAAIARRLEQAQRLELWAVSHQHADVMIERRDDAARLLRSKKD